MDRRTFVLSAAALMSTGVCAQARAQTRRPNIGWLPDDMAPLYVGRKFNIFEENGLSPNFIKY